MLATQKPSWLLLTILQQNLVQLLNDTKWINIRSYQWDILHKTSCPNNSMCIHNNNSSKTSATIEAEVGSEDREEMTEEVAVVNEATTVAVEEEEASNNSLLLYSNSLRLRYSKENLMPSNAQTTSSQRSSNHSPLK